MAEMRTDEGKTGEELGIKKTMNKRAKPKVGSKKEDLAGRMKSKGMPYTQSTQTGNFDEGRGEKAKMWGPKPGFSKGGGMPYKMWGPDAKDHGARKSGETPQTRVKSEGGRGRS